MTKILHVTTPSFTAQATFTRDRRGEWKCTGATPAVDWMEVVTLETVRIWLERNRYEYRWVTAGAPEETQTVAASVAAAPETEPAPHRAG